MAQRIEVIGDILRLPDGSEISNCWKEAGILTNEASLALMPYYNANTQAAAAEEDIPYDFVVDGEDAISGCEAQGDPGPAPYIFGDMRTKTGRIALTKFSSLFPF